MNVKRFFRRQHTNRSSSTSRSPLIIFPSHLNTSSAGIFILGTEANYSLPAGQFRRGIYDVIIKLNFIWLIPRAPSLYTPPWAGAEIPSAPSSNLLRRVCVMALWSSPFPKRTNLHSIQMRREEN